MIRVEIPGREVLELYTLLIDFNGTIACDGRLMPEAAERIGCLKNDLDVRVLTADTYGTVREQCEALGITVCPFPQEGASARKRAIARESGAGVVSLGNGFNDIGMFDESALAIAIMSAEGMCGALFSHADVVVTSPADALDLLLKPDRLRATLRS